jgi:hypothetical protein
LPGAARRCGVGVVRLASPGLAALIFFHLLLLHALHVLHGEKVIYKPQFDTDDGRRKMIL